jgi:hypothetical protein
MLLPKIKREGFQGTLEKPLTEIDLESPQPGVYAISNELYHEAAFLSSSQLKKADQDGSIAQMLVKEQKITTALDFGSGTHTMILEPDLFKEKVFIKPVVNLRTNDGKDELIEFLQNLPGVEATIEPDAKYKDITRTEFRDHLVKKANGVGLALVDEGQYENLQDIFCHVETYPGDRVRRAVGTGYNELSIFMIVDDLPLKVRLDHLSLVNQCIVDVKTIVKVPNPKNCSSAIGDRQYDFSAALYLKLVCEYLKIAKDEQVKSIDEFYFVFIQSVAPFDICMFKLDRESLVDGDTRLDFSIHRAKEWIKNPNVYTGIDEGECIMPIRKPQWAFLPQNRHLLRG